MNSSGRENRQELSCLLCSVLDNTGFGEDIRKFRTEMCEQFSACVTRKIFHHLVQSSFVITGSRAEGVGVADSGDVDVMLIPEDVKCLSSRDTLEHFSTLKACESPDVPPGYVTVTATNILNQLTLGFLCKMSFYQKDPDGYPFVSSTILRNCVHHILSKPSNYKNFVESSGPATTLAVNMTLTSRFGYPEQTGDAVVAIYYHEPKYLSNWSSRNKFKCWPSTCMTEDISTAEGYIVPVGSLEGSYTDVEWRVSYVTAENKLIQYLNGSQYKLYVVLKMIAKELIKPEFPGISSYVMKNVVLWVCELSPRSFFTPALLIEQIAKCLKLVKVCVYNNHLPNYFIPERNLLSCRLESCSKQNLIARLDYLIDLGGSIYRQLRIFTKHSSLLTSSPSVNEVYGKRRDVIEKCIICIIYLRLQDLKSFDLWGSNRNALSDGLLRMLVAFIMPDLESVQTGNQHIDRELIVQIIMRRIKRLLGF